MGLAKSIKQNSSKKVNNNKDIRVLVIKSWKIPINTASAILISRKLSMISIKMILLENKQNVKVKKIEIVTTD